MSTAPERLETSWPAVLLVCKECRKRGSGPRDIKTKDAVRELRIALKHDRPRPRVLLTNCMGLCPKKALAVAWADGQGAPRAVGMTTTAQADDALALLRRDPLAV